MKFTCLKMIILFGVAAALFSCTETKNGAEPERDAPIDSFSTADQDPADPAPFSTYSADAVIGGTTYVPVYSHIYQHNEQRTFNLTATLSIRNTDLQSPIQITKVYYYDSQGELVQKFLDEAISVGPLSSISYVVEEEDLRGGVGANFLVLWEAGETVSNPLVEAVMISTSQQQGISFVREGKMIHRLEAAD